MADWTVDEARAYLPRLRHLVAVLRAAARTSVRAKSNGHRSGEADQKENPRRAPSSPSGPPEPVVPAEALAEIEQGGIVLRDLERGIVDFPSRHPAGRQVLLCWQVDESDLGWWHLPEEGFAGRRPLPLPPEI